MFSDPIDLEFTRRAFLGGLVGTAGVAMLAPLVRTSAVLAGPSRATQVVISLGEPDSLLSGAARSALAGWIYTFIGNGLVRLKYPDMDVTKDLAETWTVSPDARTYTFTLRRDVRWQDGQLFTAEDVKFTFELWAHPEWPGSLALPFMATIEGAQVYSHLSTFSPRLCKCLFTKAQEGSSIMGPPGSFSAVALRAGMRSPYDPGRPVEELLPEIVDERDTAAPLTEAPPHQSHDRLKRHGAGNSQLTC